MPRTTSSYDCHSVLICPVIPTIIRHDGPVHLEEDLHDVPAWASLAVEMNEIARAILVRHSYHLFINMIR